MIEEIAQVTAIDQQKVTVESEIKSTCSSCQQVDNCGSGQVAKAIPHRKLTLELTSKLSLKLGDRVVLAIPEDKLLSTASAVYLLPLLGLIGFAAIAQYFTQQWQLDHEAWVILAGAAGGYVGFLSARFWQNSASNIDALTPKIVKVLPSELNLNTEC